MPAALQYLLITRKLVALEKVSFSDTQNPKVVWYHIERQLSEKQETFFEFPLAF